MKKERLHLRIDPTLLGRVREIAEKDGVTLTAVVEQLFVQLVRARAEATFVEAEQV